MSGPRVECEAHGRVSEELRALAEALIAAAQPWAARVRDEMAGQDNAGAPPSTCTWCPVCAVVGLLHGERPELAARLAEHTAGLLAALREVLASQPGAERAGAGESAASRRVEVQRVPVRRAGGPGEPDAGC